MIAKRGSLRYEIVSVLESLATVLPAVIEDARYGTDSEHVFATFSRSQDSAPQVVKVLQNILAGSPAAFRPQALLKSSDVLEPSPHMMCLDAPSAGAGGIWEPVFHISNVENVCSETIGFQ